MLQSFDELTKFFLITDHGLYIAIFSFITEIANNLPDKETDITDDQEDEHNRYNRQVRRLGHNTLSMMNYLLP